MTRRTTLGDYEIALTRILGEGSFGRVYFARSLSSGDQTCAAKAMKVHPEDAPALAPQGLTISSREEVAQEVDAMRLVGSHRTIIALYGCELVGAHQEAALAHSAILFLELCTGGELLDRLTDGGPLSEAQMRPYAWCLIDALAHCHSRGVVHRDVKLDNVLLSVEDPGLARLCDFGLAEPCGDGRQLFGADGTPGYRAPEMHACAQTGFAGPPCDAFAVGVCLFALAAGGFPWDEAWAHDPCFAFMAEGQAHGHGSCALVTAYYKGEGAACPLSAALQDLIDALLRCDPATRGTLGRALTHPWVAAGSQPSTMDADEELSSGGTYRGLGGDEDEEEDAAPAPIEGLKKIEKRRAVRESKNSSDC